MVTISLPTVGLKPTRNWSIQFINYNPLPFLWWSLKMPYLSAEDDQLPNQHRWSTKLINLSAVAVNNEDDGGVDGIREWKEKAFDLKTGI